MKTHVAIAFLFLNSKLGCLITCLLKVAALTIVKSSLFNRMRRVLPANSSFFDREIKLDNNNNNNNNKVKKGEGKAYIYHLLVEQRVRRSQGWNSQWFRIGCVFEM